MKLTYNQWMKRCDLLLSSICGLTHEDLPDQTWRLWYEDGLSPGEACDYCLDDCSFEDHGFVGDDSPDVDASGQCYSDADPGL